jgi:hypothetical protein
LVLIAGAVTGRVRRVAAVVVVVVVLDSAVIKSRGEEVRDPYRSTH